MVFDFINKVLNNAFSNNSSSNNNFELLEAGKVHDETSGGLFGDKFSLHVMPIEGYNNLFMNRISYNTQTNAYYENGLLNIKYLKKWAEGAYKWNNIKLKIEYDWRKIYLSRAPPNDNLRVPINDNDVGDITWKFDYRIGGYIINSLNLRLSFGTFDDTASVQWFIKPLPTFKNPNPDWKLIRFDLFNKQDVNEIKNVSQFVKDEYGFLLKARLSGGEETSYKWQKSQLFRQDWNVLGKDIDVENDKTFGLDVIVELKPDIIVDPLPKLLGLYDETTSDLIIHYEFSADGDDDDDDNDNEDDDDDDDDDDNQNTSNSNASNKKTKDFPVHSNILSDYFGELLESRVVESVETQNKTLILTEEDIPYESLEIILKYLYTNMLPDIESYDEWTTLLCHASKFHIHTLVQRCEKALKGYLSYDNLSEVEVIADTYNAEQLLQYCKSFEPPPRDD